MFVSKKNPTIFIVCYCLLLPGFPLQAKPEEVDKAEQDAADNTAHDRRSDNTNISYCGSLSQITKEKYQNGKKYYEAFKKQLLDQVKKEQGQLTREATLSDHLESKIDKTSGSQFTQGGQQQAKNINAKQEKLKRKIEHFKKYTLPPLKKKNDEYRSKSDDSGELPAYTRAKRKLKEMEHQYNYMGRPLQEQQGNILASEVSMKTSDQDNEAGAYAQSGCRYNNDTGECTLTGPLYQNNEHLRLLAQRGIQEAEKFAKLKVEQLQLTEIQNAHNSDYKLFEALLSNRDTPEARKALNSNLNLAAKTAAAAKYLSCRPKAQQDSKAYHLYRAASAVFLTALINDTSYYEDTANCRATEEFTEDPHNKQINTLEKVTNLHENLFANLCLRTEPAEKDLQEKCQEHIRKIFGSNPQYLDMPRTRDNALKMFKAAHRAALSELKDKWLLIKTANEQIAKGKQRVKDNKRKLLTTVALRAASKALKIDYDAQAKACAARTITCSQFAYLKSQALKWWKKISDYYILEGYYTLQTLRWKKFVKKWQKKLSEAKLHTHLACNQKEAERETAQIKSLAEKSQQQLTDEIIKEKNKVLDDIHNTLKSKAYLQSPEILHLVFSLLLPPLHAATPPKTSTDKALGIAYGTWSFQNFILNRNQHWFLLSQDVNPHLAWPPDNELYTLAYLDVNNASNYNIKILEELLNPLFKSLSSDKDYTGNPVQAQGFPLPETRVLSTAKTINLIEGNLQDTKNTLRTVAKQLDTYIKLLKKAKERLPLGHKGLVEAPSIPVTKKVHCAEGKGKNLKFDSTCKCKENNSCTDFNFPEFGKLNAPGSEYRLVQDIAKDTLQGKLKSANVKASLLKEKSAIYSTSSSRNSPSSSSSSSRQKQGSGQNTTDATGSSLARKMSDGGSGKLRSSKKTSSDHSAANLRKGALAPESAPNNLSSSLQDNHKDNVSTVNSMLRKKGESNPIILPPLLHFQDGSLNGHDLTSKKGVLDGNNSQREHSLQKWNEESPNKREYATIPNVHPPTSNIFKIISRRYQKSAYPIFKKKQ